MATPNNDYTSYFVLDLGDAGAAAWNDLYMQLYDFSTGETVDSPIPVTGLVLITDTVFTWSVTLTRGIVQVARFYLSSAPTVGLGWAVVTNEIRPTPSRFSPD